MKKVIENIELQFLTIDDYQELKATMIEAYSNMPDSYWKESQIQSLINKFPEGQVVIKINDQLAGCALSIVVDYNKFDEFHTYKDITENYTFDTHDSDGDVFVTTVLDGSGSEGSAFVEWVVRMID